jgi:hypothetical protein
LDVDRDLVDIARDPALGGHSDAGGFGGRFEGVGEG